MRTNKLVPLRGANLFNNRVIVAFTFALKLCLVFTKLHDAFLDIGASRGHRIFFHFLLSFVVVSPWRRLARFSSDCGVITAAPDRRDLVRRGPGATQCAISRKVPFIPGTSVPSDLGSVTPLGYKSGRRPVMLAGGTGVQMSKQAMREEAERLIRESLERKTVVVKQGDTRILSTCGKCGAPNKVSAPKGVTRVEFTCKECGHTQVTL